MNNIVKLKHPYWSIYYDDEGYNIEGDRIMGRQAAGWSFLKALIKNKPKQLSAYLKNLDQKELLVKRIKGLLSGDDELSFEFINFLEPYKSAPYGGIFMPGPGINDFAAKRSFFGHDKYSLVGITHTTASNAVMSKLAQIPYSHVMPWDAIICTSNCVLDTVNKVLDHSIENLNYKFKTDKPIYPQLPVIPLGIDKDEFIFSENFKNKTRNDLGINENDVVLVYVGRLSFHAKAHHLPMYLALEACSKSLKKDQKIHLIQTGWFANDFVRDTFVNEANSVCPSIKMHFLDGKDQSNKFASLAAGDIFISLSDNIQETFGITPLEGMASSLPVIVSDWDGYKSTVRDEIDGFRIKSSMLPAGFGEDLAFAHMMNDLNYDHYVGMSVQRVAIDINDCINKLIILIKDKSKRLEMGSEGRKRIEKLYDWPVILKQYTELSNELNNIRQLESKNYIEFCETNLPSAHLDPYLLFESYPSKVMSDDDKLVKTKSINNIPIANLLKYGSVSYSLEYIPDIDEIEIIFDCFKEEKISIAEIKKRVNFNDDIIYKSLILLVKYGYLSYCE